MEHYLKKYSENKKTIDFILFNLIIPVVFFFGVQILIPFDQIFQIDSDEGIELIKSDLYRDGYQLYKQIWNDQPPLPTILWTFWLHHTGHSVANGRMLTLLFSTALVWSFCQAVRITVGKWYAILGTLWLIVSTHFIHLSSSVMMGLPSLSLVMLSAYFIILYSKSFNIFLLITSATTYAISLQIKSFIGFLIPVFVIYVYKVSYEKNKNIKHSALKSIIWMTVFLSVLGVITLTLPSLNLTQTVGGHFNSNLSQAYGWAEYFPAFLGMFLHDPDLWLLCSLSIWALPTKRVEFPLFPTLWMLSALPILLIHRPIWYHYYSLLSIPLAWLSTFAFKQIYLIMKSGYIMFGTAQFRQQQKRILSTFLTISIILIPVKIIATQVETQNLLRNSINFQRAVRYIEPYRKETKWLFTDIPIYGFMTNIKIPPEIAVFSSKRVESGNLTIGQIKEVMNHYKPEQVVLGSFKEVHLSLKQILDQDYNLKYMNKQVHCYLRKGISLKVS
jgi:hypothetical protein